MSALGLGPFKISNLVNPGSPCRNAHGGPISAKTKEFCLLIYDLLKAYHIRSFSFFIVSKNIHRLLLF